MEKDQVYGWLIFVGSIAVILVYIWAVFLSELSYLVLQLTGTAAIVFGFSIMAWIGYTLATTPPPKPIEEIEKELEKEISQEKKSEESKETTQEKL